MSAIFMVDSNSTATGDKSDDFFPGQGMAACLTLNRLSIRCLRQSLRAAPAFPPPLASYSQTLFSLVQTSTGQEHTDEEAKQ